MSIVRMENFIPSVNSVKTLSLLTLDTRGQAEVTTDQQLLQTSGDD